MAAYEFLELKRESNGQTGPNKWRWLETGPDGDERSAIDEGASVNTVAVLNSYGQKGWTVALGQHPGVSGEIVFLLQRAVPPAGG